MKKISKVIIKFFRAIFRFFDKWLITPITKLFVGIFDFFGNNGSGIEKVLVNRQSLLIISLLFALITFYTIDQKHVTLISNSAEVLYNQKVKANYNEALYVVEGIPETVDVTFVGRRWDVYLAKQYPMDGVTLDLTGYTPGSYAVNFKYQQAVSSVEYKIDPSTVNIRIYDKISVMKELSSEIIHKDNLDTKLNIDSVVLDRDSVTVKGATHQLEKVAIVKAIIDIDKISNVKVGTTTLSDVPLIAYDSEGNKLDIEIVPEKVTATIKITSPSKEVPIRLIAKGETNGVAIKSLYSPTTSVIVYGNSDAVNGIEYLPVNVDVNGVKEDKNYTINLTKPTGIREISVKTINVELKVDTIVSRDIEAIPVETINIGEGYKVQAIGQQNRTVTVIVNGSKDVIDSLDASSIKAYIDLSGLGVGEHSVEVKVVGEDSKVTYTSRVKEIKVKISQK